jgi:hypothetical protein
VSWASQGLVVEVQKLGLGSNLGGSSGHPSKGQGCNQVLSIAFWYSRLETQARGGRHETG